MDKNGIQNIDEAWEGHSFKEVEDFIKDELSNKYDKVCEGQDEKNRIVIIGENNTLSTTPIKINQIRTTTQQSDWNEANLNDPRFIKNKPFLNTDNSQKLTPNNNESISETVSLHKVSKTGSYIDLNDKPDIPEVAKNGVMTIKKNGFEVGYFTANQEKNTSINIEVPTTTGELTNTAGFVTYTSIPKQVNSDWSSEDGVSEILNKPTKLSQFENDSDYADKTYLDNALNTKQDILVDGETIKTINNIPILGEGNIDIERGADGKDAVNPFKGWFGDGSQLPENPQLGDYAYVAYENNISHIWAFDASQNNWHDTGMSVDTSDVHTFNTGEELNTVKIVNDLNTGGDTNVLSAEQGKKLSMEGSYLSAYGNDDEYVTSGFLMLNKGRYLVTFANSVTTENVTFANINTTSTASTTKGTNGITSYGNYVFFRLLFKEDISSDSVEWLYNRGLNMKGLPYGFTVDVPSNGYVYFLSRFDIGQELFVNFKNITESALADDEINDVFYGVHNIDEGDFVQSCNYNDRLYSCWGGFYKNPSDGYYYRPLQVNSIMVKEDVFASLRSNGFNRISINANEDYDSYLTFLKTTELPDGLQTLKNLQDNSIISSVHTDSAVITVGAGTVKTITIPDDAVSIFLTATNTTNGEPTVFPGRLPSSISFLSSEGTGLLERVESVEDKVSDSMVIDLVEDHDKYTVEYQNQVFDFTVGEGGFECVEDFVGEYFYEQNAKLKAKNNVDTIKIPVDSEKYDYVVFNSYANNNVDGSRVSYIMTDVSGKILNITSNIYGSSKNVGTFIPKETKFLYMPFFRKTETFTVQKLYFDSSKTNRMKDRVSEYDILSNPFYETGTFDFVSKANSIFDFSTNGYSVNNGISFNSNFGSTKSGISILNYSQTRTDVNNNKIVKQIIKLYGKCKISYPFGDTKVNFFKACTIDRDGKILTWIGENGAYYSTDKDRFLIIYNNYNSSNKITKCIIEYCDTDKIVLDGCSFEYGCLSSDGLSLIENNKFCTSGYIDAGRPFNLTVNDAYRIRSVYLYNSLGECVNTNYVFDNSIEGVYVMSVDNYQSFSTDSVASGYKFRIVVDANGDDISSNLFICKSFSYMDIPGLHKDIPDNGRYHDYKKRLYAMSKCLSKPVSDQYELKNLTQQTIPVSTTSDMVRYTAYKKGNLHNGIPYSEALQYQKMVGLHISFKTFITAIMNKRSVMYTERICSVHDSSGSKNNASVGLEMTKYGYDYSNNRWTDRYATSFYGTVCTGLTGYLFGSEWLWHTEDYAKGSDTNPRIPGMVRKFTIHSDDSNVDYNYLFKNIKPMWFHWRDGHCSAISDIYRDDSGEIKYICWAEEIRPGTIIHVYNKEQFINRIEYIKKDNSDQSFMEYQNWENADLSDLFGDFGNLSVDNLTLQGDISIDSDICTFKGDYVTFLHYTDSENEGLTDNKAFLNVRRNNDSVVKIYQEESDISENEPVLPIWIGDEEAYPKDDLYPQDDEDWVILDLKQYFGETNSIKCGFYKACVESEGKNSGFTHFEVVSADFELQKNNDGTVTVNYNSINCEPICASLVEKGGRIRSISSGTIAKELTYTSHENDGYIYYGGTVDLGATEASINAGYKYMNLLFRGKYGSVAVKKEIK